MSQHPARLAAAFTPPIPTDVAAQLLAHPRFKGRIDAMFGGPAPMDRATLDDLARRAGPVLHARSFVREIRGPVIAELTARFGAGALADARAHADLGRDRDAPADAETITADGIACLGAWIAALPDDIRTRITAQWPDDASLPRTSDATILTLGPQIIDRLAAG